MGKRTPADEPMYRVWRADDDEDDYAENYGALSVRDAARLYADYCHRHRDGWEWTWPITFHVRNLTTGETFAIEVVRETVPDFQPGDPMPLVMEPAVHVLWHGRALCSDIRLDREPAKWPTGQTWIGLPELARVDVREPARDLDQVTCQRCKRRAPGRIEAMRQIGALP